MGVGAKDPVPHVSNPFGGISAITFPGPGHYRKLDSLGLVLQMEAFSFQNYHVMRANNVGQKLADIVLPAPNQLNATNGMDYAIQEGISWNFSPTFWEEFNLTNYFAPGWRDEAHHRTKIRDMEARFGSPNLRSFTYSWNLVPKETGDADRIAKICKTLQTMSYPTMSFTKQDSRFVMPAMWIVKIVDVRTAKPEFRWDMGPMPSVLTNVTVSPTVAGGVYTNGSSAFDKLSPVATSLSLTFLEIDLAVAKGTNTNDRVPYLVPLSVARNSGGPSNPAFIRDDI